MADKTISLTAVTPTTIERTDILARLRVELHDEDAANERWVDATLQQHIERAVRELSQVAPRERLTVLSTVAGTRDISVAAQLDELVNIEAVEWPTSQDPPTYIQWSLYQTTLTLLGGNVPSAVQNVNVYWGQLHTLDDVESTLLTVMEDAIVQGAAGYAALEWANYAINRANIGGAEAQLDYRRWGEEQLERFRSALQEFGKEARLRASGLFTPAGGPQGRDVVRWQ